MSIEYIQIPAPLLDSEEFQSLAWGDQKFLFSLYRLFYDVQQFTIELDNPTFYFQSAGVTTLSKRVWNLCNAGLIEVCGHQKTSTYGRRRVFKFKDWE